MRTRSVLKVVALSVLLGASCVVSVNAKVSGPQTYWLLDQASGVDGDDFTVFQPDHLGFERQYVASVTVDIEFHEVNDDGTKGAYIGHTSEGTSTKAMRYGDVEAHANDLGSKIGYAAAGMAGQELGNAVSNIAVNAAKNAAEQASPLNPAAQWGSWFSSVASTGRNFAGRLVGALGGIF